jgi:hypothetical protein
MAKWSENLGWSRTQTRMYSEMAQQERSLYKDSFAQKLFTLGWFDMNTDYDTRKRARGFLTKWMRDEYGVDFDAVFDWNEWRERYGAGEI